MNAGAYGGEMKDIVQSVRAVDYSGNAHEFSAEELDFGYRHSKFCGGGYIITEATLRLAHGDMEEISAKWRSLPPREKKSSPLNTAVRAALSSALREHLQRSLSSSADLKATPAERHRSVKSTAAL